MPNLNLYKKLLNSPITNGQVRKDISDDILNQVWWEDIAAKKAYLYDYYHDKEPLKFRDIHPEEYGYEPVDIKYIYNSAQTFEKDEVTWHIQFRPGYNYKTTDLVYYETGYEKVYNSIFPLGMYIAIPDETGKYNKWLVVNVANYYTNAFPTFDILPCTKIIMYKVNNMVYKIAAPLRSQNSYNSGLYQNKFEMIMEDQQKMILPSNNITNKIGYNLRMILDATTDEIETPRAWIVSKINRINPNGLAIITLAQDEFNKEKDFVGYVDGEYVAVADYYDSTITPEEFDNDLQPPTVARAEFTYSSKAQVKVGGGYKTLTLTIYDETDTDVTEKYLPINDHLTFKINGKDASDLLDVSITDNKIKIKFLGDSFHLNEIITVEYDGGNVNANTQLAIVAL